MIKQPVNKAMEIIVNNLLDQIRKNGVMPWVRGWSHSGGAARPVNMAGGRPYNMINSMILLSFSHGKSNYWISPTEIKKRGLEVPHKSLGVCVYGAFKKKIKGQFNTDGTPKEQWVRRFTTAYNASDVDGLQIPAIVIDADHKPIEAAESIAAAYLTKHSIKFDHHDDVPCYNFVFDSISMPTLKRYTSPERYYQTMFHEMAHSTGHNSRLDRPLRAKSIDHESYSLEELIAEMTACYVSSELGLDLIDDGRNSAEYCRGWCEALGDHKEMFFKAAAKSQQAAEFILTSEAA